jgi:hypothetical protein
MLEEGARFMVRLAVKIFTAWSFNFELFAVDFIDFVGDVECGSSSSQLTTVHRS